MADSSRSPRDVRPGPYHVLIAEDDPTTAEVMRFVLETARYRVTLAHDGQQALDFALDQGFDAIVADVAMPRMSGIELVARLRTLDDYTNTPVILVTAKALEIDRDTVVRELKIAVIFDKPFSPTKLLAAVQAALAQSE